LLSSAAQIATHDGVAAIMLKASCLLSHQPHYDLDASFTVYYLHSLPFRYRTLGRNAEARDAMTAALSMPIWTLCDVNLLNAAKVCI
jgi:hypothetical protein